MSGVVDPHSWLPDPAVREALPHESFENARMALVFARQEAETLVVVFARSVAIPDPAAAEGKEAGEICCCNVWNMLTREQARGGELEPEPEPKPEPEPEPEATEESEVPLGVPPVPEEGLPEGWTMEQWAYYGQKWLNQNKGD